jgi:Ca-activated chloride channel homolog
MRFGSPYLLFVLFALPLAVGGYWTLERRRVRRAVAWSRPAMLPNVVRRPGRVRYVPAGLFLLGMTLLLVGFARPRLAVGGTSTYAPTVVLTIDVSGSMAADDVRPTRIAAARSLAIAFLHDLSPAYRVAVVTFGNRVRVVVPPTLDRSRAIAGLPTAITPRAGTSLGDGVSAAVATIAATAGNSDAAAGYPGAIVLLSDGAQTGGGATPDAAAATASVERIPVETVMIGTARGIVTQPLTVDGFKTSVRIAVPSSVTTMDVLSRQTGGTPFEATSAADLNPISEKLTGVLGRLTRFSQPVHRERDLSAAAGGAALVVILGGLAVSGRLFGRLA